MAEKQLSAAELDKNLIVPSSVNSNGIAFFDVRRPPFNIYGLYNPTEGDIFRRMPQEVADKVNNGVASLCKNTAGGRLRFSTNSKVIAIRAKLSGIGRMSHFTLVGSGGFDLYLDDPVTGHSRFVKSFMPPYDMTDGYESVIYLSSTQERYFTIHFPLYSCVNELYIGIKEGSTLSEGLKYKPIEPIVYYGSSITQGGCASRPGNAYSNIITRRTQIDHINLGFSGSGRGEDTIIEYMAGLSMSAFVCDYDHNAPNAEHLAPTHRKLYDAIRAAHPDIPYIMISKCDVDEGDYQNSIKRRHAIYENFVYAREKGDMNLYFLDGAGIFRGSAEAIATVDACHPNDHGFTLMANAIEAELLRAYTQKLL